VKNTGTLGCEGCASVQTQRLCLGRALLHDPQILIMDEPAAGLDPKARVELKHLIRVLEWWEEPPEGGAECMFEGAGGGVPPTPARRPLPPALAEALWEALALAFGRGPLLGAPLVGARVSVDVGGTLIGPDSTPGAVRAAASRAGSRSIVSGSMSTKTGRAPSRRTAVAVAKNECETVTTSSPGPMPARRNCWARTGPAWAPAHATATAPPTWATSSSSSTCCLT
jgi:hypothetical protein